MSEHPSTKNDARERLSVSLGYVLVALFWVVQVCVGLWWLKVDTRPPFYDLAGHATAAIRLARAPFLSSPWGALKQFLSIDPYPPFVYLLSVPFVYLFGPTADALMGSLAILMAVLLFSTYELGRRLDRPSTGLAAALLLGMYPIVYGLSRQYLLDVPLAAMVALTMCCLVLTDRFRRLGVSLFFGLSAGLGMLTKWTFVVFVAVPFVIVVVGMLREGSSHRLRNGLLGVLVGGLVAAPWYLVRLARLHAFLQIGGVYAAKEGDPLVRSLEAWTYYAKALVSEHVFLVFALFFVVGLVLLLARGRSNRHTLLLLAWIIVPYLTFSGFVNKNGRYVIPYLPAIALITAWGLAQIRNVTVRRAIWAGLAVYAVVQFVGLSFGLSQRLGEAILPPRVSLRIGVLYAESAHTASPPRAESWPVQEILEDMLQDSTASQPWDRPVELVVIPNRPYFEPQGFIFYTEAAALPVRVDFVTGVVAPPDTAGILQASDYVVTKTGDQGPAWSTYEAEQLTQALRDPDDELGRQFVQIGEYPLPDGSLARLYRRRRG